MRSFIKQGISLKTQIYSLVIIIAAFSFVSRLFIGIGNTTEYFQEQMSSHAQDAATSLGLSISPYMDIENRVIAETMMTAIFDSGYYAHMELTDTKGHTIIKLDNPNEVESVPTWFMEVFPLHAPKMHSEVNDGWQIAATLSIQSHPGVSYLRLWQYSQRTFYGSLFILVLCLLLAHLILRSVFKPLQQVELQAKRVTQKNFTINESVPFTKELRTVTAAINNMVTNLHVTFDSLTKQTEQLTQEAYIDKLTGFGNRRAFDSFFNSSTSHLKDDDQLAIFLVTLPSLQSINNELGYLQGDHYVTEAIEVLKTQLAPYQDTQYFRLAGGSIVILFNYPMSFVTDACDELIARFNEKQSTRYIDGFATLSIGEYGADSTASNTLSELDTQTTLQRVIVNNQSNKTHYSLSQWRTIINEIIDSGEVNFTFQPIKEKQQNSEAIYYEVFVRFLHKGAQVNNGHLFAMAERLGMTIELDKKLIREFAEIKESHPTRIFALNLSKEALYSHDLLEWLKIFTQAKACLKTNLVFEIKESHPNRIFALNLSKEALYSQDLLEWLKIFTQAKACLKSNLVFEIKETALLNNVDTAAKNIDFLKELGITICVEHFGISLTSFKYLQGLDIEYVKIDGSYTQDLISNRQNNFFISTINNICHGVGIKVIACLIEDEQSFTELETLGCDGFQGNFIQQPLSITTKTENSEFTFQSKPLESQ